MLIETEEGTTVTAGGTTASMSRHEAWERDVRIRVRPGRANSGVKLYVTDRDGGDAREFMANTGFMRYPRLLSTLVALMGAAPAGQTLRVLIVPLSVGLEAVSLVIAGKKAGLFDGGQVTVEGFDISAKATALARGGLYPRLFFPDDLSAYDGALSETGDGFVEVAPAIMRHIAVLPAGDVLRFEPPRPYEMVICLNLLMHLPEAARPALVDKLCALTAPGGLLCLNNNQEWPGELMPHFDRLTAPGGGFASLHGRPGIAAGTGATPAGPVPAFAVTDANAMLLRKEAT